MRTLFVLLSFVSVVVGLSIVACGGPTTNPASASTTDQLSGKLVLTGSSTVAPLAGEIAKRFESLHSEVRIDVQTGGSSRGIADARSGLADIGMASRSLAEDESDLYGYPIAQDGVALIVHADNPIRELSDQQIVDIFTGRIETWSEVGGLDEAITVISKAEGRATLEMFLEHFGLTSPEIEADVIIGDNEQGIKLVSSDRRSIGYVSIGTAEYQARQGASLRLLPAGGVPASIASVTDGTFPIARSLLLITDEPARGLAAAFIDYARSDAVHDLVASQYFVPVS